MPLSRHHQMMKIGSVRYNGLAAGEGGRLTLVLTSPLFRQNPSDQVHHRLLPLSGARRIE